MPTEQMHIMLVEDDVVDVMMLRRAFELCKIDNVITVARDGLEALDILRGGPNRQALPRPYLILLDLNLPRMNGIEFLQAMRADATLQEAIVFVLTTSRAEEDMQAAYRLNVSGYIVKSNSADGLHDVVTMLKHYWQLIEFP